MNIELGNSLLWRQMNGFFVQHISLCFRCREQFLRPIPILIFHFTHEHLVSENIFNVQDASSRYECKGCSEVDEDHFRGSSYPKSRMVSSPILGVKPSEAQT